MLPACLQLQIQTCSSKSRCSSGCHILGADIKKTGIFAAFEWVKGEPWVYTRKKGDKVFQLVRCRLLIRGSLVQFPTWALWSVLGQDSLFHIASVYPVAKWVPSINKAVLRACALYAASCSGISPGIEMISVCVLACYGRKVV